MIINGKITVCCNLTLSGRLYFTILFCNYFTICICINLNILCSIYIHFTTRDNIYFRTVGINLIVFIDENNPRGGHNAKTDRGGAVEPGGIANVLPRQPFGNLLEVRRRLRRIGRGVDIDADYVDLVGKSFNGVDALRVRHRRWRAAAGPSRSRRSPRRCSRARSSV